MSKNFYDAIKERRSIYSISKESPVSDERIKEVIEDAVKHVPSSFNSQSSRVVVLFGEKHDKLWDIAMEALRKIVPEENFYSTEQKINSFKAGHGTVLYFEDFSVVESLQKQFELYKDNFPVWAEQTSGMLQFAIWTALSIEGLGATLQHYTELIEDEVKREFKIPNNWNMIGQMPFGKGTAPAGEKEFSPIENRVKILK
ncbi:nitroreductase family protein [Clostridium sp. DSM 100503]|uniref:nitroreductase family protein n=1 Tax=Clostridium sp. DSM 100503 TaxID=2963282 RepID=UPI00214A3EBC|nr:nitroreductase family protein [Clostridium sp. DSM 100503]MCR1952091.1 nitroreductase family protein [Clostridium sp. DSM 100503]